LAGKLRITWRKSAIGYKIDQKRTIEALGLRKLGHSVEHDDNRAVRGMVTKVRHLVEVAEVGD
jgi:large subunit ribosomal protein L30